MAQQHPFTHSILAGFKPGKSVSAFGEQSANNARESQQNAKGELESLLHVIDVGLLTVLNQLAAMPLDDGFAQALRGHHTQLRSYQGAVHSLLANIHNKNAVHALPALMNQVSHLTAELHHALRSRPTEKAEGDAPTAFTPQMDAHLEAMPVMVTLSGMMLETQASAKVVRLLQAQSREIEAAFADFNLIVENVIATGTDASDAVLGKTATTIHEAVTKEVAEEIMAGPDKLDAEAVKTMVESRFAARWNRMKDSIDHVRTGMREKAHDAQESFMEGRKRMQEVFRSHVAEPARHLQAQLPEYQKNCAQFLRESAEDAKKRMDATGQIFGKIGAFIHEIDATFSRAAEDGHDMGVLNRHLMNHCAQAQDAACSLSGHFDAQANTLNDTMQMIDQAQKGVRAMARGDASGLKAVGALLGSDQAREAAKQVQAFHEKYLPGTTLSLFASALPHISNAMKSLGFGKDGPSQGPPRPPS